MKWFHWWLIFFTNEVKYFFIPFSQLFTVKFPMVNFSNASLFIIIIMQQIFSSRYIKIALKWIPFLLFRGASNEKQKIYPWYCIFLLFTLSSGERIKNVKALESAESNWKNCRNYYFFMFSWDIGIIFLRAIFNSCF